MKKKIVIIGIIIVVLGGVIGLKVIAENKYKNREVKTVTVSKGDVNSYLSTTASVKSKNSKEYYGAQGKIKSVNVKVGDKVTKGQVLIAYDVPDLSVSVKQAEIQYNNAILQKEDLDNQCKQLSDKIAELDNQIKSYEGSTDLQNMVKLQLAKQQRSSLQPVSEEKIKQATNSINLAKLNLDAARQKVNETKENIICEYDGIVTALNAVEDGVSNGVQPIVIVQDINALKAVISVGKYDANKIQVGQDAIIRSGEKQFKAKVSFIEPAAKKSLAPTGESAALGVELDILEKAEGLKIDFDCDVDILLGKVSNTLKVPVECIKTDKSGKSYVFVLENNVVKEKDVRVGLQSDLDVQILDGLKGGEKVILNPAIDIKDGVQAKETTEGAKK